MAKYNRYPKAVFPLSLLLTVALTACGQASLENGDPNAEKPPTTEETPTSTIPQGEPKENGAVKPTTNFLLSLAGDGVLLVDEKSGKTQIIPFQADLASSQAAISSALGKPTETTENKECGAGAMSFITWDNGFTMNAMQNQFVGWTVRPETDSAKLTTMDGIGMGSTLTQLKANYTAEVIQSTLGTEFFVEDSLSGLLSVNEPNGVITHLWAGTACNFR